MPGARVSRGNPLTRGASPSLGGKRAHGTNATEVRKVSHVTELARMEAEETEREEELESADGEPETEPDDDDDGEPEAVAPQLPTFDEKALEAEQRRHEKALDKVFGGLDAFDTCDGCGGIGVVPKGLEAEPELLDHPTMIRCDHCNGLGVLRTGSANPQYMTLPCDRCTGTGYLDREQIEAAERARQLAASPPYLPPAPPPTWDQARGVWIDHNGQPIGAAVGPMPAGYTP